MSDNHFRFTGLDEFREGMRHLAEMGRSGEATHIVEAAANGAATRMRTEYGKHRRTGNLQKGVVVEHAYSAFGSASTIKNTARHASLYENGTQARHTAIGADRGSMPAGHVFIPAMIRARREMEAELKALLERLGLVVTVHV